MAAAVPGVGDLAKGARMAKNGAELLAKHGDEAADILKAVPDPPNRIYSARELLRRGEDPGPYHNFPESFNDEIFERGTKTVTPGFFNKPRAHMSNDSVQYRLPGEINNRSGTYEIFARPSQSGRTEVITHRFFRPDPR